MKLITKLDKPVDLEKEVVIGFTLEEYGQLVKLINMGVSYHEEMFERAKRSAPRSKSFYSARDVQEIEAGMKISRELSGNLKTLVLKRLSILGLLTGEALDNCTLFDKEESSTVGKYK